MEYSVGDIITYYTFGGTRRTVRVDFRDPDIKNGNPGFDATIVDGPDTGMSVWGYDDQIAEVHRFSKD